MTKIFVPLPNKKNIDFYLEHNINGFFLGIEGFSINFNHYIKLNELDDYINSIKKRDKTVYISLNKLYYDKDIEPLKKLLIELSKHDIDGIDYCDVAVYNIVKENNIKLSLIWNSNHLGTNSKTINFWNERGVEGAILSNEITIDEALIIRKKTSSKLGMVLYGYLNMVTSSRSLITNYLNFINKENNNEKYFMHEKVQDKNYPIIEENGETNIFSSEVLNGIKYFPILIKNKFDFIKLDDYLMEPNSFYNVIEAFCALMASPNDDDFVNKLKMVVDLNTFGETYEGFLNKKTVFKVKDYE